MESTKITKKKHVYRPPSIRYNSSPPGPWAKSDEEKIGLFACHLSEVFTPHNTIPNPEIESKLSLHTACSEKISAFNITELNQVIKRLHPRKAPEPDLITARMIQELAVLRPKNPPPYPKCNVAAGVLANTLQTS